MNASKTMRELSERDKQQNLENHEMIMMKSIKPFVSSFQSSCSLLLLSIFFCSIHLSKSDEENRACITSRKCKNYDGMRDSRHKKIERNLFLFLFHIFFHPLKQSIKKSQACRVSYVLMLYTYMHVIM